MGRSSKQAELTLLARVDEKMVERSIKRLRDMREAEQDLEEHQRKLTESSDRLAIGLGGISGALGEQVAAMRQRTAALQLDVMAEQRMVETLRDSSEAYQETAESAERYAMALDDIESSSGRNRFLKGMAPGGQAFPESPGQVGGGGVPRGAISGGFSAIASVLPGEAGGVARSIGEVARLIEQLPRMADALRSLTGVVPAASTATAEMAAVSGTAAPAVAGLAISIGSLAAITGIGIAIAAVAIAINQFVEEVKGYQEALDSAFEAQLTKNELLQSATKEEVEAELERIEVRKRAIETTLAETEAAREAAEAVGGFEGALASLLDWLGVTTSEAERAAQKELQDLAFEQKAYQDALQSEEVQRRHSTDTTQQQAQSIQQQSQATEQATRSIQQSSAAHSSYQGVISSTAHAVEAATRSWTQSRDMALGGLVEQQRIRNEFARRAADYEDRRVKVTQDAEQRRNAVIQSAMDEQDQAMRRLEFDIAQRRAEAGFGEAEMAMDRDFAGIARSRRQTEFDIAQRKQQAVFDAQERSMDAQLRLNDASLQTERAILDIRREGARLEIERAQALALAQSQLLANLAGLNTGVPGGGAGMGGGTPRNWQSEITRQISLRFQQLGR